jgi:hypothetical protein
VSRRRSLGLRRMQLVAGDRTIAEEFVIREAFHERDQSAEWCGACDWADGLG